MLVRLKVKLCLFVLDRPTHNLNPDSKTYIAFSRGKIFLSFAAKMSNSMPGIQFESHMFVSSMDPRIFTKYIDIHQLKKIA